MSSRAVIIGIVSSVLFMVMHLTNPEVLTQSGAQVVLGSLCYFLTAMGMYFVNIYFHNLMPGLIIHWGNNFVAFTLVSSDVSVLPTPSLFVDTSEVTGFMMLLAVVIIYIPLYVYIAYKIIRKK